MSRETGDLTERAQALDRDGRAAYRIASTDWDVSTTVVAAVEEVADVDLLADGDVLYDVLDPDALNDLFDGRPGGSGKVVFDLRGCRVEVRADGDHLIYGPDGREGSADSTLKSV